MKTIKLFIASVSLVLMFSFTITSCGSMTEQQAYDTGYQIGTLMRQSIDN
jgi:hypothetical protein